MHIGHVLAVSSAAPEKQGDEDAEIWAYTTRCFAPTLNQEDSG